MTPDSELSEREYFARVRQYPDLFVGRATFHMVVAFLTGYDQHAARHGGAGLDGLREWLFARRGKECDHAWPGVALHIALPHGWRHIHELPPEDDARAVEVLFRLLDEFLAERETAQAP
ncbi:hypothetical protein J7I94_21045 [Streptomyces sp. ISL-12]|uniref:hypothetical protein n=1 Tax=Streptomyces sp. ISL-12 TaxID=2819177 RepID=UPI001BEBA679|nr:hypothetical protein [Streptomyces sp. ISL-12]MBT2413014.1 hypothetical protein [Streptomyces sp. ISL-12]